jgi:hypothetical protein
MPKKARAVNPKPKINHKRPVRRAAKKKTSSSSILLKTYFLPKNKKTRPNNKQKPYLFGTAIFVTIILLYSASYVIKAVSGSQKVFNQVNIAANGLLVYSKNDIAVANLLGSRQQLINEITGWQSAPSDLQDYVFDDYKAFKKTCIVNGQLIAKTTYNIKSVVYDKYALVGKYCNGVQNNVLAKISNKWTVIYSNNNMIPCSLVNDFNVPKGISYFCATDGTTYVNPNP